MVSDELGFAGRGEQKRVAPRGKQGEVEARDGTETPGDHEEVPRVAAEGEGNARGSLDLEEPVTR